jgi:hypothetical protein
LSFEVDLRCDEEGWEFRLRVENIGIGTDSLMFAQQVKVETANNKVRNPIEVMETVTVTSTSICC